MNAPSVIRNPLRTDGLVTPASTEPIAFHRRLPGYAVTPMHDLAELARELGVGRLLVKDESERLGLHAFKMLGASWAVYRALTERIGGHIDEWSSVDELAQRIAPLRPLTLATATDGNHGQAVARTARLLGLDARIWVPASTSQRRIEAIAGEGADVVVSAGSYDDAVREAARSADNTTVVISDTSWEGYEDVPRWVIEGYSTIFVELDGELAEQGLRSPDLVVVPIGVGALAAAVVTHWRSAPAGRPSTVIAGVEPVGAACVTESVLAGHVVSLEGEQTSVMAGLNCGTPSPVAWERVSTGVDWMVTVTDHDAEAAVRSLAEHGVVAGESGAATLAGLRRLLPVIAETGVDVRAMTVLLLSTEGATDPDSYARILAASSR